jgi:hypothetical protein
MMSTVCSYQETSIAGEIFSEKNFYDTDFPMSSYIIILHQGKCTETHNGLPKGGDVPNGLISPKH